MSNNQVTINDHNSGIAKVHFVLVPFMAQGHMIPMVDMAHHLIDRGSTVSFITTPVNAARIKPTSNLPITFVEFKHPCTELGLPEGMENLDLVTSADQLKPFMESLSLLQEPLELYLQDLVQVPVCIISDICNQHWTAKVARKFNIPRITFHGPSCLYILSCYNIQQHDIYKTVADDNEPFVVPGLPQRFVVTKAKALGWFTGPGWEKLCEETIEAVATGDGVVVNSFQELEPEYLECYEKAIGKKVWSIGPLSLYNKNISRGNKASIDEHQLLSWLDSMEPQSVLYISFGSLVRVRPSQLIELGCGLEASNRPFIWVIKEDEKCEEVEKWMSDGFKERTKERSLIITGWAPQILIVSHPSIGGFMTHCGWNSTLEAIAAGVPMITWPYFSDQFINEKLVVEVLRIGVAIGVELPISLLKVGEVAVVRREDVEKTVISLMDGGEEGKQRRERVGEFADKARKAMKEGGSSFENLTNLILFVLERTTRE